MGKLHLFKLTENSDKTNGFQLLKNCLLYLANTIYTFVKKKMLIIIDSHNNNNNNNNKMLLKEKVKSILKKIRRARLEKEYTQDYVGNRLYMSQKSYHRLENGKSQLKVETLLKLAVILEVDVTYFFKDL